MKKRALLYSLVIFLTIIFLNIIFTGKAQATTYSKDKFQVDIPSTYNIYTNTSTNLKVESSNKRNALLVELVSSETTGKVIADKFLEIVVENVKKSYGSNVNITSYKNIEKEASICPDVVFSRVLNGDTYYYEIYVIKSDNYLYTLTFVSFEKSFLTSSEKNNIWNSFKVKDTVTCSYGLPFTDVASKTWYRSAVEFVYTNNIINGLNNYTYGPNEKLSRAMMATILYNMAGKPSVTGTSPFSDVKDSSKWYYKAVLWASKNNIVSGYKDGSFGPNDNITREQLAIMLYKYAKYKGKNVSKLGDITKFTDYKNVASYAVTQVKWAVGAGVITGSNNKLNPKGNATRAEAASMIYKYCSKVGK